MKDFYITLANPTEEILFKEKNSKFYGYGFPVFNEPECKPILERLRKLHPTAGHFCYAYRIGAENPKYRANDDGEPSNSAGMPIYGQILSKDLTNVLVIIVRYFGGTKLGVSGLISSYRSTAKMVLDEAIIIQKNITINFFILFEYKNLNKVMRIIKEKNLNIVSQKMDLKCEIEISVLKSNSDLIFEIFKNLNEINIR